MGIGDFKLDINESYRRSLARQNGGFSENEQPKAAAHPNQPLCASMEKQERELILLLEDSGVEKIDCFGGKLFRREDGNGDAILSFALEGMTEQECTDMIKAYSAIYQSSLPRLIGRGSPFVEKAGPYTVFNFVYSADLISLRQYCEKNTPGVKTVMRRLVNIVSDRKNRQGQNYEALNCFGLDTVFVDTVDPLAGFWLLPLRAYRNYFPREIAPEARDPAQKCTELSDLYAAAFVAIEAANKMSEMVTLEDGKIKDCLMPIPQCRPSLSVVAEALRGDTKGEIPVPSPVVDFPAEGELAEAEQEHEGFFEVCKKFFKWLGAALKDMFTLDSKKAPPKGSFKDCLAQIFRRVDQIEGTESDRL